LSKLPEEMRAYYDSGAEKSRLQGAGKLESLRTKNIILRNLPSKKLIVLDVGGGPGHYSFWLSGMGHRVGLVDPVPLHISQARRANTVGRSKLTSMAVGDARKLDLPDESVDVVLLLGPLYHLTSPKDRLRALSEAPRTKTRWCSLCCRNLKVCFAPRWKLPGSDRRPGLRKDTGT
jgi:ubiquinone/menaquinone biosynthesis C-methylase UbiE